MMHRYFSKYNFLVILFFLAMLYAVWSTYRPHVGTAWKTLLLRITANVNMWAFISIDYKALMQMVLAAGHILPEVSSGIFYFYFFFKILFTMY